MEIEELKRENDALNQEVQGARESREALVRENEELKQEQSSWQERLRALLLGKNGRRTIIVHRFHQLKTKPLIKWLLSLYALSLLIREWSIILLINHHLNRHHLSLKALQIKDNASIISIKIITGEESNTTKVYADITVADAFTWATCKEWQPSLECLNQSSDKASTWRTAP